MPAILNSPETSSKADVLVEGLANVLLKCRVLALANEFSLREVIIYPLYLRLIMR